MPRSDQRQSLIEFCEPFFLEVGNIFRVTDHSPEAGWQVRGTLKSELDKLYRKCEEESAALAGEYRRIEPVLAFYADDVIINSTLAFAPNWRNNMLLATEPRIGIVAGAQQFFLELEATLREGAAAAERLAIFQTCLGLGFGGIHRENPGKLRQYSAMILQQINLNPGAGQGAKLVCKEAYEHIQTDPICKPVAEKIWAIGIIGGALVLATLVAYVCIELEARSQIGKVLHIIINR